MRQFSNAYKDDANLQQLVGEIPWGTNIVIFTKYKDNLQKEYYIEKWKKKWILGGNRCIKKQF